jgi:hypothetical protein
MPAIDRTLTRDLQASAVLPILELVLFVVGQHARRPQEAREGFAVLLEGWGRIAGTVLDGARKEDAALAKHARTVATRAIRITQGYESAARDKAYQCLVEYLEGRRGVDRDLTDEECVAINNGMLHAFAGYGSFLDHTAGAVAGGGR